MDKKIDKTIADLMAEISNRISGIVEDNEEFMTVLVLLHANIEEKMDETEALILEDEVSGECGVNDF